MKNIKLFLSSIIILLLSIVIVCLSLLLGSNVESYSEFRHAKFGLPIPFLFQDLYITGAKGYLGQFPHRFPLQLDFLDNNQKLEFILLNFIASVLIVFVVIYLVYILVCTMRER